jgi:hypothetical protein
MVSLGLGCIEVGFTRLWVGHGETRDAIEIVIFEEMSFLPYY